jgi:GH15 family glucan-1,4-alpha-glucosidase
LTLSQQEALDDFKRTVEYWRHWISKCSYTGRWREMVQRSALARKLITRSTLHMVDSLAAVRPLADALQQIVT